MANKTTASAKPGIRLVDLKRKERTVTGPIDFADGKDLTVIYDAAALTGEALIELQRASADNDLDGLVKYLSSLIVDWDVEGDGGDHYPTDRQSMLSLPMKFLNEVTGLVMEDLQNPTTGRVTSD